MRHVLTVALFVGGMVLACKKDPAPSTDTPAASVVPAPPATSTSAPEPSAPAAATAALDAGEPWRDNSPAAIAKVLSGISDFKLMVQQRLAIGRERSDVCDTTREARTKRVEAIENGKMGGFERLTLERTRWACCAPNIDQTIDALVVGCLSFCTDDDTPHNGSEEDDWAGPGGLRQDCQRSLVALDDWATELKAGKF